MQITAYVTTGISVVSCAGINFCLYRDYHDNANAYAGQTTNK